MLAIMLMSVIGYANTLSISSIAPIGAKDDVIPPLNDIDLQSVVWILSGGIVPDPIIFDNVTPFNGVCDPCTFSHSVNSGNDQIIIVGVSAKRSASVSGVTYDGLPLTQIRSDKSGNAIASSLWYRIAPSSGNNIVSVNLSTSEEVVIGAMSLNNVNQVSPIGANNGAKGNSNTPSVDITTTVDDSWIVDVVGTLNGPMTAGGGQTERWDAAQGTIRGAGSTEVTTAAGSYTMSWTNTDGTNKWTISAAEINPLDVIGSTFGDVDVTIKNTGSTSHRYEICVIFRDGASLSDTPGTSADCVTSNNIVQNQAETITISVTNPLAAHDGTTYIAIERVS